MNTEMQPDIILYKRIEPEVKSITDKESFDLIWNNGYRDAINKANEFMTDYIRSPHNSTSRLDMFIAFNNWIEDQRKSLNK